MRQSLKRKIWLFTLGPLVALAISTMLVVGAQVEKRDLQDIEIDLATASENLQDRIETRARDLATIASVISRDPKFFAMFSVPAEERGPDFVQTVGRLAVDFHRVAGSDLFDIMDEQGRMMARAGSSGGIGEDLTGRRGVRDALAGRPSSGVDVDDGRPFLAAIVPIVVGGEISGVLRVGTALDARFAAQLKGMTRSDVTFVVDGTVTSTTLGTAPGIIGAIERMMSSAPAAAARGRPRSVDIEGETYVTHAGEIDSVLFPGRFRFVIQRSLREETVFLNEMRGILTVIGAAVLLLSLLAGFLAARGITGPITSVVRAAQEMERGNYEYPLRTRGGDEIAYLAKQFGGMRASMRDYITRLEEVDRMKSNFITVASHELRTPLTALHGFLYLMRQPDFGPLTESQHGLLGDIEQSMEGLTKVVQQVTDMSLLDTDELSIQPSPTDVGELLADVFEELAASQQGKRRLRTSVNVEPGLPSLSLDRERMGQAVRNILSNAYRFTPDGGEIVISAARDEGEVLIAVRDTGVGIPASEIDRIFERIYESGSVHNHSSGSLEFGSSGLGLGLPIAKGIVEAHGGRITLSSSVGSGSVFTIHLRAEPSGSDGAGMELGGVSKTDPGKFEEVLQ